MMRCEGGPKYLSELDGREKETMPWLGGAEAAQCHPLCVTF